MAGDLLRRRTSGPGRLGREPNGPQRCGVAMASSARTPSVGTLAASFGGTETSSPRPDHLVSRDLPSRFGTAVTRPGSARQLIVIWVKSCDQLCAG